MDIEAGLVAVGVVRSSRSGIEDDAWDAESSIIELLAPFDDRALRGLEGFSHCLVVYHLDRASWDESRMLRRPRGNPAWPEVGIFASAPRIGPIVWGSRSAVCWQWTERFFASAASTPWTALWCWT